MPKSKRKPGLFYLVVSIVILSLGVLLAGRGVYVGFCGTGWADGFVYLSFGLTAVVAASTFATVRGQMIAQQETEDRILEALATKAAPTTQRTLKLHERVRVLFGGSVGGQP